MKKSILNTPARSVPNIGSSTQITCSTKDGLLISPTGGICVVFLPSPRCQVCYRRYMFAAIARSSDHWTIGSSSTKFSCHAFLSELTWRDAHPSCTGAFHIRLQCLQVHELSTSPSNKIGPWRVPGTAMLNRLGCVADANCTWSDSRINVPTARTLSRIARRIGFTALWRLSRFFMFRVTTMHCNLIRQTHVSLTRISIFYPDAVHCPKSIHHQIPAARPAHSLPVHHPRRSTHARQTLCLSHLTLLHVPDGYR